MGRISACFEKLRATGERALVPFLTAGDPDFETSLSLLLAMADAGADLIEIGVPFSDPIGEGPTIQRSSARALERGASLRKVLDLTAQAREKIDTPFVLMGYANPFLTMGETGFATAAAEVGVDGVIVPDLPPEEGKTFFAACRDQGIDPILLAAPTTSKQRLALLAAESAGFLYYVSVTGVTGARTELAAGIESAVAEIRSLSPVPVCVGFGISTPEQAAEVGRYADGAVVGSAIVNTIEAAETPADAVDEVARLIAALKAPLRIS